MKANKALYPHSEDCLDALLEIERSFDIKIPDDIAINMFNVGDLYNYLNEIRPTFNGKKCITSMSFNRLKRNLQSNTTKSKVIPDTLLQTFITETPKHFWTKLEQNSQLHLPPLKNTLIGNIALTSMFLSFCGFVLSAFLMPTPMLFAILLSIFLISLLIFKLDPLRLPETIYTVGDLAKETATLNYGKFEKLGARTDDKTRWNILTEILSSWSDPLEAKDITRETPFY